MKPVMYRCKKKQLGPPTMIENFLIKAGTKSAEVKKSMLLKVPVVLGDLLVDGNCNTLSRCHGDAESHMDDCRTLPLESPTPSCHQAADLVLDFPKSKFFQAQNPPERWRLSGTAGQLG